MKVGSAVIYKDAVVIKHLKNSKVAVSMPKEIDGDVFLEFIVHRENNNTPCTVYRRIKNRVDVNGIRLSIEAAKALHFAIGKLLDL